MNTVNTANGGVVLIVDDVPANLEVLMEVLELNGFKVLVASDGASALQQADYARPDIILLDVMMPGLDGFETCERLKARAATRDIPVIFMTALTDIVDKVHGFEVGAADYITKPLHQEEVVARVQAHLTLYRQKQEIARLRQQEHQHYERLSRLKDEMLNTASHDLKNPLATIMTTVGVLRLMTPPEEAIQRKLDKIEAEAIYMRDLITNLLDLARLEAGNMLKKTLTALNPLVEASVEHALTSAAAKGIRLGCHLAKREVRLDCDPMQMGRVLDNLISNAIKYTPAGGRVEVRVEAGDHQAWIHVIDTGLGIPARDLPHLFDRFYRVNTTHHQAAAGSGLGLSIVKVIVEQHGGQVQVRSEPGVGSTFSVGLPL